MIATKNGRSQFKSADPKLESQVRSALSDMPYPQLRSLECSCHGGKVTLQGRLDSFYLKQLAQTVAMKSPGVREVFNQVDVVERR